jgi:t-SNARE complex subunit (syntaxin)
MRDLGALVQEQEVKVETIEAHVAASAQAAEAGTQDIEKAASYVAACRWKGCVAALVVSSLVTTLLVLHFAVSPPLV